jgi:hypothetical protein
VNQVVLNLSSSYKNLHVSIPAALSIACEIASIFDKTRTEQWKLASKVILGYTALAAANSGPSKETQPPLNK